MSAQFPQLHGALLKRPTSLLTCLKLPDDGTKRYQEDVDPTSHIGESTGNCQNKQSELSEFQKEKRGKKRVEISLKK